jgi:RNA polymerase sigma-70 factor (ECF subfamily)
MTSISRPERVGRMDEQNFEKIFKAYFPALMAFSRKILGNEDDAREVVHQVFIKLWERRTEIDLSTSLKSYLFTAVNNRSLNVIRDRKKFSSDEVPERVANWDVSTELESLELEERIREAIASLPERCRVIFELNRFEGLSYGDISKKLGISVKTVENQMSKALKILREQLANYLSLLLWFMLFALN